MSLDSIQRDWQERPATLCREKRGFHGENVGLIFSTLLHATNLRLETSLTMYVDKRHVGIRCEG